MHDRMLVSDCVVGEAFQCSNGFCVPGKTLCDGNDTCGDGSDENTYSCTEQRSKQSTCFLPLNSMHFDFITGDRNANEGK